MKKIIIIFSFWILCLGLFGADITLQSFVSLNEEHGFWKSVRGFQDAVAVDLGVTMKWVYEDNDHFKGREDLEKATSGAKPINGGMVVNFKQQGENFFQIADKNKVPVITNVVGADFSVSGKPREKHKFWIAEMSIDEEKVGYELAKQLINAAEKNNIKAPDGKIYMGGITGDTATSLSQSREKGMMKAVKENKNVVYYQTVPATNWSTEEGYQKTKMFMDRYPNLKILWAANDDIALGIVKAVKEAGKVPGKDLLTGGIDWVPEALQKVKSGEMVCSIGGLFMHGGWATILFYDYINGKDFKDDTGVIVETQPEILTKENVNEFLVKFGDGNWGKVDFKAFSKVTNPKLKKYDFTIKNVMQNMKK